MPKKSRRVASRQAQLSGRSKRARAHGPAGIPATKPPSPDSEPRGDDWTPTRPQSPDQALVREAPEAFRPASSPPPRSRGRTPQARPIESYFFPELRRIGVASAVIGAILVVLVFVLR